MNETIEPNSNIKKLLCKNERNEVYHMVVFWVLLCVHEHSSIDYLFCFFLIISQTALKLFWKTTYLLSVNHRLLAVTLLLSGQLEAGYAHII